MNGFTLSGIRRIMLFRTAKKAGLPKYLCPGTRIVVRQGEDFRVSKRMLILSIKRFIVPIPETTNCLEEISAIWLHHHEDATRF